MRAGPSRGFLAQIAPRPGAGPTVSPPQLCDVVVGVGAEEPMNGLRRPRPLPGKADRIAGRGLCVASGVGIP